MVSAATVLGFLVVIVVNTAVAAVLARFFRLRLKTRIGAAIYTTVLVPVVFVLTTLVLGGVLGFGGEGLADTGTALILVWVLPFTLGYSIHLFWMPPIEEVELPEQSRQRQRRG